MPILACTIAGCEREATDREWCHKHYEHLRSRGELPPKPCKGCGRPCAGSRHYCSENCKPRCAVEACEELAFSKTWCNFHLTRWKLTGDPAAALVKVRYAPGQMCSFQGCAHKARRNALCASHATQERQGKPLTPLAYRSDSTTCAFCGGPTGIRKGYRRVCSPACSRMWAKHGAPLPETFPCTICGDRFPYVVDGQRRKKFDTKTCNPCRRASMKHGYSPKQLAKRDGTDCKLCGGPVDMTLSHPDLMRGSVDHIIPSSLGGSNDPDNVQLAHLHCNIKKNNRVDVIF